MTGTSMGLFSMADMHVVEVLPEDMHSNHICNSRHYSLFRSRQHIVHINALKCVTFDVTTPTEAPQKDKGAVGVLEVEEPRVNPNTRHRRDNRLRILRLLEINDNPNYLDMLIFETH